MHSRAQVSIEYMVLLGGVIIIATAIYFATKSLVFQGGEEINKTHDEVSSGLDKLFNKSQVKG